MVCTGSCTRTSVVVWYELNTRTYMGITTNSFEKSYFHISCYQAPGFASRSNFDAITH